MTQQGFSGFKPRTEPELSTGDSLYMYHTPHNVLLLNNEEDVSRCEGEGVFVSHDLVRLDCPYSLGGGLRKEGNRPSNHKYMTLYTFEPMSLRKGVVTPQSPANTPPPPPPPPHAHFVQSGEGASPVSLNFSRVHHFNTVSNYKYVHVALFQVFYTSSFCSLSVCKTEGEGLGNLHM